MTFVVLGDAARTLQTKKQSKGTLGALCPFPLCIQSGSPACGMIPHTFKVSLPSSAKVF